VPSPSIVVISAAPVLPISVTQERTARPSSNTVQSPALSEPTAEFGAVQHEIVAQYVKQRRIRRRRHRSLRAVDLEADRHRLTCPERRPRRLRDGEFAPAPACRRAFGVVL